MSVAIVCVIVFLRSLCCMERNEKVFLFCCVMFFKVCVSWSVVIVFLFSGEAGEGSVV